MSWHKIEINYDTHAGQFFATSPSYPSLSWYADTALEACEGYAALLKDVHTGDLP